MNYPATVHTHGTGREVVKAGIGSDPFAKLQDLEDVGRRKAEAEGVAYQLDHERKIVLAEIATEIDQKTEGKVSETKLERLARADPRYREHIKLSSEWVTRREATNSEYWAIKSEIEWDEKVLQHLNALSRLER